MGRLVVKNNSHNTSLTECINWYQTSQLFPLESDESDQLRLRIYHLNDEFVDPCVRSLCLFSRKAVEVMDVTRVDL